MARKPSLAQRAIQITFALKGHLKNAQISYLRVAAGLAQVRDQRLFRALKHDSLESYAAERLGLGRASVYRYLQIYDWVREFHPAWLARKPKGFIPELTDAYALMWIDRRLADERIDGKTRRDLESYRKKALAGKLSHDAFQRLQGRARGEATPLHALLSSLRSVRRRAKAVPGLPSTLRAEIDALIARVAALVDAAERVASLVDPRRERAIV